MAKWVYVALIVAIATGGVSLILKFGYKPVPKLVMSPTPFEKPEEIGAVVLRRFFVPIQHAKIAVVGVPPMPAWHQAILQGFLATAIDQKIPFDVVFYEAQMPPLDLARFQGLETIAMDFNTPTQADLIDRLRSLRAAGKRILIYTASVLSAPILKGNPLDRLERALDENLLSITTGPLALRADQEHLIDPPCLGSERDKSGTSPLGCEYLRASRWFYRKRVDQSKWVAIMNEPKQGDYLLLISEPGQGQKK